MKPGMTKILAQIPKMKIRETVTLWHNAIRILEDPRQKSQHSPARIVLDAIGAEWEKRRKAPLDKDDKFDWPSTDADPGSRFPDTDDWIREGVLQYMGYRVGDTDGERQAIRQRILSEIFNRSIPPVFPRQYLDQWEQPSSVGRLKNLAETIAALARNAKRRRDDSMRSAIRDWERDLEFLYYEYYVEKFHFAWPSTAI
jgi:hypothetical protein